MNTIKIPLTKSEMKSLLFITGTRKVNAKAFLKYYWKFLINSPYIDADVNDTDIFEFIDKPCTSTL